MASAIDTWASAAPPVVKLTRRADEDQATAPGPAVPPRHGDVGGHPTFLTLLYRDPRHVSEHASFYGSEDGTRELTLAMNYVVMMPGAVRARL